jgi:hypothetical protein
MLPGSMANRIDGGKAWASSGVGWMCNEQYLLEAFLSFNPAFELIGAVNWLSHHHRQKLHDACPILMQEPEREPASFWFRRVDAAEK